MSALQATWLFSLAVQVAAFSLAIAALSKDGVADAYVFVLWLELAISGAQLVWYSVVYALVFLYKLPNAVNTRWRFVDWAVTTPAMLVTLNVLIKAWHDECLSLSDMWTTEFVVANVAACFFNAIMLLGGYMVESERIEYETEYTVLAASFTPLCLAFLPSVVHVTESYSGTGLAVLLTTFVVCVPHPHSRRPPPACAAPQGCCAPVAAGPATALWPSNSRTTTTKRPAFTMCSTSVRAAARDQAQEPA